MVSSSSNEEWDLAEPRPEALVESLRAFGYSPETAIADLIDNSISANSRHIDVTFYWDGQRSHVAIVDDGDGMTDMELLAAMRPGGLGPLQDRPARDLGRFGLGLKTASFSQARELSVLTRKHGGSVAARRWDLDEVARCGQWRLLRAPSIDAARYLPMLKAGKGTAVVWTKCDRLVGGATTTDKRAHQRFLQMIERTSLHLSLVFHRFMTGRGKIVISVNGQFLQPMDPFLEENPATQGLGTEYLPLRGHPVEVRPFVLPHRTKLSQSQQQHGAGLRGWNGQQGFYVYRANRLLVAGDWLGLGFTKDEHAKLARISVNFPAVLDHDWQIDVKKSTARPPGLLVDDLRRLASITRSRAEGVYRHRGKVVARQTARGFVHAWTEIKTRDGGISYRVNRQHPVLAEALRGPAEQRRNVERVLRFVEETVPTTLIGVHLADALENQPQPYKHATKDLRSLLAFTFDRLIADGSDADTALQLLAAAEPFAGYPELIQALKEHHDDRN